MKSVCLHWERSEGYGHWERNRMKGKWQGGKRWGHTTIWWMLFVKWKIPSPSNPKIRLFLYFMMEKTVTWRNLVQASWGRLSLREWEMSGPSTDRTGAVRGRVGGVGQRDSGAGWEILGGWTHVSMHPLCIWRNRHVGNREQHFS